MTAISHSHYYWLKEADKIIELMKQYPDNKESLQKELSYAIAKAVENAYV